MLKYILVKAEFQSRLSSFLYTVSLLMLKPGSGLVEVSGNEFIFDFKTETNYALEWNLQNVYVERKKSSR